LIGSVLIIILSAITIDRYRDAMRRRGPGRLRTGAAPTETAEPDPGVRPILDPESDTQLVIRLGGVRIPAIGENAGDSSSSPAPVRRDPSRDSASPPSTAPPSGTGGAPARRTEPQAASAREIEHTVGEGETLGEIAKRYFGRYDKWKAIAEWNGISDPRKIRAGQKLRIRLE